MTAPAPSQAHDRWQRIVKALGLCVTGDGQAEMPCPVHDGDKRSGFTIGVGDAAFPLFWCRTGCDSSAPGWLAEATAALLALGAPADALPPVNGGKFGQTPSAPPPARKAVQPTAPATLPSEATLEAWDDALWREPMIRNALRKKWGISDDTVTAAEVGWDESQRRLTLPVRDEAGALVTVIYRDLRDNPPPSAIKSRVHKGTTGSHLYSPFGVEDRRVVLCAGERDVLAAHEAGFNAVGFTGGEGAVPARDRLAPLQGREVVIAYDVDAKGKSGAAKVAAALLGVVGSVAVADLSVLDLPDKGDLSDALVQHGAAAVRRVLKDAVPWEGAAGEVADGPQPVDWQEFWSNDPEPIRYLVEPLFAMGEVTRLYAQAKVGKSLLVQECAAALAMGRKVLGQAPEATTVVYIDQENTWEDWKTRLADMGYGAADDWSRLHWYSLQSWPALDTEAGGSLLVEKVLGHSAALVVIDTQSKVLEGEEDKALTSAAFYRHTLLPLKRLGVAMVIIDHAGNDATKPRGSTGKRDDVDVVWQVSPRGTDRLTLTRTHSRKRHGVDVLAVDRLLSPLRHEVAGEGSGVTAEASAVDACVDAICGLDPIPAYRTSARQVGVLLREAGVNSGKGFRAATVREAWKAVSGGDD